MFRITILLSIVLLAAPTFAQKEKSCFTKDAHAQAVRSAKIWEQPNPGYDPVLGYNPNSPRAGALPVDQNGMAKPLQCSANKDPNPGAGTTPKFHCSKPGVVDKDGDLIRYKVKPHFKGQSRDKRNGEIQGDFLGSRFSKAVGFFADDDWVADVSCPDCEKSLTRGFQGTPFTGNQPAAGIELPLGKGIDADCDGKDSGALASSLDTLAKN